MELQGAQMAETCGVVVRILGCKFFVKEIFFKANYSNLMIESKIPESISVSCRKWEKQRETNPQQPL